VNRPSDWFSRGGLAVLGTGHALPGDPIDNDVLFRLVAPHAAGLSERTIQAVAGRLGIETRHVSRRFAAREEAAVPGQDNAELAARAVRTALSAAGLAANDLGYLIAHTATPVQPLPSNVAHVADLLDYGGPHVELRQACTGFANALMIAFGLLAAPDARPVCIVGSETGSLFFDPARAAGDHGQCVNLVQMGDGAGAIVLARGDGGPDQLRSAWFGATGLGRAPGLQMRAGAADFEQDFGAILSAGPALFAAAIDAAARQGLAPESADIVVPHQASGKIGHQLAAARGIDASKVFVNADRVGNTGSAAIWIALAQLRAGGLPSRTKVLVLGAEATKYMHGGFEYAER
jgi:3-oxoacyl-[acyl-carrier-protein] synthase III